MEWGLLCYCVDTKSRVSSPSTKVFHHDKPVCLGDWPLAGCLGRNEFDGTGGCVCMRLGGGR